MNNFYEYFTKKCIEIGKTPSEVARACGINPSSVTGWKRGSKPKQTTIQVLKNYFNEPEQTPEETAITYLFGDYKPTAEEWKVIVKLCDTIKQAHKENIT